MPTPTFFNLPEEKRQRIVEAAMEEFAQHSFSCASIASIIERAQIPRGSFYQYFDGLKDLYKYIFQLKAERKMECLGVVATNFGKLDTLQLIRELYSAGVRFAAENPRLAQIGSKFLREDPKLRDEILGDFSSMSLDFFEQLLKAGQENGDIDKRVDTRIAAFMFYSLNNALVDYLLMENSEMDLVNYIDEFLQAADKVLYILENGLKASKNCNGRETQ